MFFFIASLLTACRNKKAPDVSNIKLDVHIERFDKDMDSLTPQNVPVLAAALRERYGPFYDDFMTNMLSAGSTADTAYYQNLRTILDNPDYRALKGEVALIYPDMSAHEKELTEAFKYVKYYYPQQSIPRIISFFSGFAVQIPVGNNYIGIGLDMFLGVHSKFYPALRQSIPEYISRRFTPENITPRVMEAFIREDMFPEPDENKPLLGRMIYNGKIMYFMKSVMPEVPDSVIIGYTSAQQKWCETYEPGIWGYFLEQNLLYETDYMKIQKYLTEAPFTPGIGEKNESAPKLAVFSGWQIVKEYMKRNPKVSLQAFMKDTDYQGILNRSRYRPK